MADKPDSKDDQIKSLSDQLTKANSAVDALTRERDALRDQLSIARHTLNPLPAGEIQKPDDLDDYKGEYKNLRDGQTYGLKIDPEARGGKTHLAKCHHFSWDGTPEEFRLQFEKV